MCILSGVGNNSSHTILKTLQLTKIRAERLLNKELRILSKSTPNKSICSHKNSMMFQITPKTLKIPDLSKTGLADILDMP